MEPFDLVGAEEGAGASAPATTASTEARTKITTDHGAVSGHADHRAIRHDDGTHPNDDRDQAVRTSMGSLGCGASRRMSSRQRFAAPADQATRSARGMPSAAILFSARTAIAASTHWASRLRERSPAPSARFSREKVHSAALRRP